MSDEGVSRRSPATPGLLNIKCNKNRGQNEKET